jgi:hypothetical protein
MKTTFVLLLLAILITTLAAELRKKLQNNVEKLKYKLNKQCNFIVYYSLSQRSSFNFFERMFKRFEICVDKRSKQMPKKKNLWSLDLCPHI